MASGGWRLRRLCSQIPCPKDGPGLHTKTKGYEIQFPTTLQRSFVPPFLLLLRPVLWSYGLGPLPKALFLPDSDAFGRIVFGPETASFLVYFWSVSARRAAAFPGFEA